MITIIFTWFYQKPISNNTEKFRMNSTLTFSECRFLKLVVEISDFQYEKLAVDSTGGNFITGKILRQWTNKARRRVGFPILRTNKVRRRVGFPILKTYYFYKQNLKIKISNAKAHFL